MVTKAALLPILSPGLTKHEDGTASACAASARLHLEQTQHCTAGPKHSPSADSPPPTWLFQAVHLITPPSISLGPNSSTFPQSHTNRWTVLHQPAQATGLHTTNKGSQEDARTPPPPDHHTHMWCVPTCIMSWNMSTWSFHAVHLISPPSLSTRSKLISLPSPRALLHLQCQPCNTTACEWGCRGGCAGYVILQLIRWLQYWGRKCYT